MKEIFQTLFVIVLLQVVPKMIAIIDCFEKQDEIKNSVNQSVKVAKECRSDFVNMLLIGMGSSKMIPKLSMNLKSALNMLVYLYYIWTKLQTHLSLIIYYLG